MLGIILGVLLPVSVLGGDMFSTFEAIFEVLRNSDFKFLMEIFLKLCMLHIVDIY